MITKILSETVATFGVVLILMLIDLITGLFKVSKTHTFFTSSKLRNSINKSILYFIVLLIGSILSIFGEPAIGSIFVVFLCLVEGVSILENLSEIFPNSQIIKKITKFLNKETEKKM